MSIPCSNYVVTKDGKVTGPGRFTNMSYGAKINSTEYLSNHTAEVIQILRKLWNIKRKDLINRDFPGVDSPDDIAYLIYVHAPENMYGVNGEIVPNDKKEINIDRR